ncbi:glycosyltransferase family 2 protein [soil metagenome]
MDSDTLVSVVAPLRDDALILAEFVEEVVEVLRGRYSHYELILVDNDSRDGTSEIARKLLERYACLRLIRLARPYTRDLAVTAGLDAAIGDYVVVMRPRSDPPGEIPAMVRAAGLGDGIVLGTADRDPRLSPLSRICRMAFFGLARSVIRNAPPADATGFCALSRSAVNAITRVKLRSRHLNYLSCAVGCEMTRHPYRPIARLSGSDPRPLRESIGEGFSILFAHSAAPLRLVSQIGALAASLNLLYVLYVVGVNLVKREVAEGWTTLSLQIAVMFFFVFLNLTILAEYIAQIARDTQDRPLYHIRDDRSSAVKISDPERRNVA